MVVVEVTDGFALRKFAQQINVGIGRRSRLLAHNSVIHVLVFHCN